MKINKILTRGIVGAILAVGFIGCGNPPQPYNYKLDNQYSNISDYEKQQLLNIVIDRNSRLKYKSSNGCVMVHSVWGGSTRYDDNMKNCFIINNNKILRKDKSHCRTNYRTCKCNYIGRKVEKYSDFINNLQKNIIAQDLQKEIKNYIKFKKMYNEHKKNAQVKKKNIVIHFIDTTKILPKNIIKQLSVYNLSLIIKGSAINRFIKNQSANAFVINSSIKKDTIDRYKVVYSKTDYLDSYDKFPSNITYKINKVYFNYLPKKFIANDKNIDVEVINDPLDNYESIKYIKIYNKTKEFIEIDTIAGYYGDIVTDNIINIKDMKRVKISPMSYKIFKIGYSYKYRINDFPRNKFLLVNDKNQKVNYGFSIGYKMINQNIIKNLYKVNTYSIKDFE